MKKTLHSLFLLDLVTTLLFFVVDYPKIFFLSILVLVFLCVFLVILFRVKSKPFKVKEGETIEEAIERSIEEEEAEKALEAEEARFNRRGTRGRRGIRGIRRGTRGRKGTRGRRGMWFLSWFFFK